MRGHKPPERRTQERADRDTERMMERYGHLVKAVIRKSAPGSITDDDAVQCARIGLWEACVQWDGKRSFVPFARSCIRHNLIDYLRGRREGGEQLPDDPEDCAVWMDEPSREELAWYIRAALPARSLERRVLLSMLAGKHKDAIAKRLGVTRRTVQRCAVKGWERVRAYKESREG